MRGAIFDVDGTLLDLSLIHIYPGMRGIQGASSDMGDSFFKKNGGTTKEAMFIKLTTTIAILFLITTTVLVIFGA